MSVHSEARSIPKGIPTARKPMRLYQMSLTLPMLKQAIEDGKQARTAEAGRETESTPKRLRQGETKAIALGKARRGSAVGMQSTMLGLMMPQGRMPSPPIGGKLTPRPTRKSGSDAGADLP